MGGVGGDDSVSVQLLKSALRLTCCRTLILLHEHHERISVSGQQEQEVVCLREELARAVCYPEIWQQQRGRRQTWERLATPVRGRLHLGEYVSKI